jgi:hypothetical protein
MLAHVVHDVRMVIRLLVDDTLLHELLIQASVVSDPVEDALVPQQAVVPLRDPVALIGEVQETARHAQTLQDIEGLQSLRDQYTVVQVVMDNELGGAEVRRVDDGIPLLVIGAVVPDCAVVVALDEPQLIGRVAGDLVHLAVVADESLELAAKIVALNPLLLVSNYIAHIPFYN